MNAPFCRCSTFNYSGLQIYFLLKIRTHCFWKRIPSWLKTRFQNFSIALQETQKLLQSDHAKCSLSYHDKEDCIFLFSLWWTTSLLLISWSCCFKNFEILFRTKSAPYFTKGLVGMQISLSVFRDLVHLHSKSHSHYALVLAILPCDIQVLYSL